MEGSREPLLTLSPSQNLNIGSPKFRKDEHNIETTPTLPGRERLASISRLLKRKNCLEFSEKTLNCKNILPKAKRNFNMLLQQSTVDIKISPCSPRQDKSTVESSFVLDKEEKGYLSPNCLPFSPSLLTRRAPAVNSLDYRQPSPIRSPLYTPDRHKRFLGRGSFGKVSLCKYKESSFALKVIHHPSQFIGEESLLGIRHPHLVEVLYISKAVDKALIFMEFAGHCNLQQILSTKSELDFKRKLSFCIQIASGLRYCHENNIIHGDVKPANVIVSPLGICKLGDFGHSMKVNSQDELVQLPYEAVGTAIYAAPEVLKELKSTTLSDVYSFGILLWQVHTREMPFEGEHPHVVIYKVVNYGARPKFPENKSPTIIKYIKTAEDCWNSDLSKRINANTVVFRLQMLSDNIKKNFNNLRV